MTLSCTVCNQIIQNKDVLIDRLIEVMSQNKEINEQLYNLIIKTFAVYFNVKGFYTLI